MERDRDSICLWLSAEEADELLSRCLNSEEGDTPAFQRALLKLARAAFPGGEHCRQAPRELVDAA